MINKILMIMIAFVFTFSSVAYSAGEWKTIDVPKVDAKGRPVMGKDGKPIMVKKKVKVHKKLEGTKVPDKKPTVKKNTKKK